MTILANPHQEEDPPDIPDRLAHQEEDPPDILDRLAHQEEDPPGIQGPQARQEANLQTIQGPPEEDHQVSRERGPQGHRDRRDLLAWVPRGLWDLGDLEDLMDFLGCRALRDQGDQ